MSSKLNTEIANIEGKYPTQVVEWFWERENRFWHVSDPATGNNYIGFLSLENCCECCEVELTNHIITPICCNEELGDYLADHPAVTIMDMDTQLISRMARATSDESE